MNISTLVLQSVVGISYGMDIFIAALGITLIFGVARIINFAHGAFYAVGAYACFSLTSWLMDLSWNFWVALLIGPVMVSIIGGIAERLIVRRTYAREHLEQILLMYAIAIILGDMILITYGGMERSVMTPDIFAGALPVAGLYLPLYRLFLILLGLVMALGVWLLLNKTRIGAVTRAAASDSEMANALGVNVPFVFTGIFMLGCWLAGVGGVLIAPLEAIWPGMGTEVVILSFIIVVIGGGGTIGGCLLASLIVGLVQSLGILFLPRFAMVFIYGIMIIILLFRPQGLMGRPVH